MPEVSQTAYDMISNMTPKVRPGAFVFVTFTDPAVAAPYQGEAISTFREAEGMSMILPVALAEMAGFDADHPMRCITLNVYSSLDGVGLTAAVSGALGDQGIPCNMVAAYHHDHVFVPSELCDQAMQVLTALQSRVAEA